MKFKSFIQFCFVMAAGITLVACAEAELTSHMVKTIMPEPGTAPYKVGNPYVIFGKKYYPKEEWDYEETGIASWYGPNFHGKKTANGETYNQYDLTAAHRTLPLPSVVRVTNLENGRSIVVRINDRGPYHDNRIIDLSKRGAELLDVIKMGTAKVRVTLLPEESLAMAKAAGRQGPDPVFASNRGGAARTVPVVYNTPAPNSAPVKLSRIETEPLYQPGPEAPQPPTNAVETEKLPSTTVVPNRIYVQAGAFSQRTSAEKFGESLADIGPVVIKPGTNSSGDIFRVRFGPLPNTDEAKKIMNSLNQYGHSGLVVVD